jgi:hypothetical protein
MRWPDGVLLFVIYHDLVDEIVFLVAGHDFASVVVVDCNIGGR